MNYAINDQQRQAITSPLTPQLVIAGAGSGKTFVLIERIVHLIQHANIPPQAIWAITFTNKAAAQMRQRIKKRVHTVPTNINTFHKSCLLILRKHGHFVNLKPDFRVLNLTDQTNVIKRLMRWNLSVSIPKFRAPKVVKLIRHFKTLAVLPENVSFHDFLSVHGDFEAPRQANDATYQAFQLIYQSYLTEMVAMNALDFDDIIIYADKVLAIESVLTYWQNQFQAILVDEFQDTDALQFKIVNLIAKKHQNLFCVGDPDQAIYSWRGAFSAIFEHFLSEYPQCQTIILNQNYRSSQKILNVANQIIAHNSNRMKKDLFTENPVGNLVHAYLCETKEAEAQWICQQIRLLKQNNPQLNYHDIVILSRNNHLDKQIRDCLSEHKIAYQLHNGAKFYDLPEIKTVLNYLYLILSDDLVALEHVYNVPKRKITDATFTKVIQHAKKQNISWVASFHQVQEIPNITAHGVKGCLAFIHIIDQLRALDQTNLVALIDQVLVISGYQEYLSRHYDQVKLDNLEALKSTLEKMIASNEQLSLVDFLSEIALYSEQAEFSQQKFHDHHVQMMTIHGAKGLEFAHVFVTNLIEGILPSERALGRHVTSALEEERRLMYVACTRAKTNLFLSGGFTFNPRTHERREHSRFFWEAKKSQDLNWVVNSASGYRPTPLVRQKTRIWINLDAPKPIPKFVFSTNTIRDDKMISVRKVNQYHPFQEVELIIIKNNERTLINYKIKAIIIHNIYGRGQIIDIFRMGEYFMLKIQFERFEKPWALAATNQQIKLLDQYDDEDDSFN